MHSMRLQFQKEDWIAIAGVFLLAVFVLLAFLPKETEKAAIAEIYLSGVLIRSVPLDTEQEFTVDAAYSNTVSVHDGKISVITSNCPGEDCVRCGAIRTSGRSIVCLPNKLEIRIVSESSDVDFIVG